VINFLEATVYFIVLPDQSWLLVATVLLRTLLLIALSAEYGLILFDVGSPRTVKLHGRASAAFLVCVAASLCALVLPLGQAYVSSRNQAQEVPSATGVYAMSGAGQARGELWSPVARTESRARHSSAATSVFRAETYPFTNGELDQHHASQQE